MPCAKQSQIDRELNKPFVIIFIFSEILCTLADFKDNYAYFTVVPKNVFNLIYLFWVQNASNI